MIEALAERLHDLALDVRGSCDHAMFDIHGDGRPGYEKSCVLDAEFLADAGVTVAPQTADRLAAAAEAVLAARTQGSLDDTLNRLDDALHAYRVAGVTVAAQPAPDALSVKNWTCNNCANDRHDECKGTMGRDTCACSHAQPAPDALRDYGANPEYSRGWQDGYRRAEAVAAENRDLRDQIDAIRAAAQEHGLCSCADFGGPRPLGNGQEYHYVGCDYDPALRAALEGRTA